MPPPPAQLFASRVLLGPALRAQPDRRLVDLVRDGYDSAFEEIVRRYRRPLDRFAAGIVGGRAEDVTQDAFSKALQSLRRSDGEIELRPWLYRIVRNTALNDLRDRGPSAEQLLESLPGSAGADAAAERREELAQLMRRLHELPEAQRAALVMRELEGLSHDEIAAALGVSGGAARQAIHRARSALRDGLGLLVPMPLLRAIAERGGEAVGATAAGAGLAGAGLGGGAIKVGLATMLVAGSVAGGVAIRNHQERVGPETAAAAPNGNPDARIPAAAPGAGEGGAANGIANDRGNHGRSGEGEGRDDGSPGPGPGAGIAESHTGTSGSDSGASGPRHHAADGSVSGSADGHGDRSGPGAGESGGDDHGGIDDNSFDDHSGPGGGDSFDGGGGGDSSSGDSSGPGSGGTIESELQSGSDSSGSGSSGSGSSGSGSSGDGGASLEPATDGGASSGSSGSGDSGTSGSGSSGSDDILSGAS